MAAITLFGCLKMIDMFSRGDLSIMTARAGSYYTTMIDAGYLVPQNRVVAQVALGLRINVAGIFTHCRGAVVTTGT